MRACRIGLLLFALVHGWSANAANKTFAGPGNFSNAALWSGGTLPAVGDNLRINGTCTFDNAAANLAYGTLQVGRAANGTLNWPVGATNTLNVFGIVATAFGFTGTIDMTNGGTLQIGAGNWVTTRQTFIPGTGTIVWNDTVGASLLPAAFPTYNNLTILCAGRVASLGVATTVNGTLLISAGTLDVTAANLALNVKGNFTNNGTFNARAGTVTLSGTAAQVIGGTTTTTFRDLTITNSSAAVSANTNFNVSGTLTIGAGAVFSPAAAVVVNNAAAQGTITGTGTIQVTRTAATADYASQYKFTTNTLNNLTVDYAGAGNQTINVFTYGALITSNSGTKQMAGNTTVNGAITVLSGTTLDINTRTVSAGPVTLTNGNIAGTSGVLTGTSYDVQSGTVSAILGGAGVALTKTTAGTVTLSGVNTYTGATTINAGTLLVNGSLNAASAVAVNAGATLGGTGSLGGAVTVASGGTVSPGVGGAGTLSAGAADFSAGGTLLLDVSSTLPGGFDVLNLTGALTVGGSSVLKLASVPGVAGGPITVVSYGSLNGGSFGLIDNPSTTTGVSASYSGAALTLTFSTTNILAIEWDPSTLDSSGSYPGPTATALWTLNPMPLGGVHRTDTSPANVPPDVLDALTLVVKNTGGVNEALTVTSAANTVPAGWTIGAAAGYNVFEVGANNDNSSTYNSLHLVGFTITTGKIRIGATQEFDLRFAAPLTTNTVSTKSIALTVTASAPP